MAGRLCVDVVLGDTLRLSFVFLTTLLASFREENGSNETEGYLIQGHYRYI